MVTIPSGAAIGRALLLCYTGAEQEPVRHATIRYTELILTEETAMAGRKKSILKSKGRNQRRSWTKEDHRELKTHSKNRTPVAKISRAMKRTAGALRQQALKLGIGLGHRR
jgi:hypothetical protein